jgi:cytochrome c biogenesis protein CcmG/thiol:disulfide interchange protein DsbE
MPPSRLSKLRRSRAWTLLVLAATAVVILAVSYLANRPAAGGSSLTSVVLAGHASGPPPEVGKPAPDFTATTLEGAKTTLSGLRGRPLWLTFGATWCQECRAENPDIEAAWERYRSQGLQLVYVFIQDDRSTIEEYAKRVGLSFTRVDDAGEQIANSYRIAGIPSHFFIDRTGTLREIRISALDPREMDENLAEIGVRVDRPAG